VGGNQTFVRFSKKKTIDQHSTWDESLGTNSKFPNCSKVAAGVLSRSEFQLLKLPESKDANPEHGMRESIDVAERVAYADMTIEGGTEGMAKYCQRIMAKR